MTTTRQLELFIAVAEEGSMRKAADRLGISQPTVSKQMLSLERSVGGKLILRSRGGRAVLSPLGRDFLGDARSSLEMHRRFVQREGVGVPPRIHLRSYLLEIVKKRFDVLQAAGLPSDTSFIVSDDPLAVMAASDPKEDAFAVIGLVSLPATKDFLCHVLGERTCSIYAAPSVAAALAAGSLKPSEVANLYPSKKFRLTPWLRAMMRHSGFASGHEVFGLPFVELVAEKVARGEGISIFMDYHIRELVEQGSLVALAPCRDALMQVLMADPSVDSALFSRVCRALHAL